MGGNASRAKKKLLFLGLDNAGKSSILEALTGGFPQETAPTRGYKMKQLAYSGMEFTVFDIGGQQSLRLHWADYYDKVAGIVWVIDSTDRRRMFETGLELATILKDPKLDGIPLLIMANKQDLVTAMPADEITLELELHSIRNRNWHIQNSSAIEDIGIEEGMKWMVQSLTPQTKDQVAQAERELAALKAQKEQRILQKKEAERNKELAEKKAKEAKEAKKAQKAEKTKKETDPEKLKKKKEKEEALQKAKEEKEAKKKAKEDAKAKEKEEKKKAKEDAKAKEKEEKESKKKKKEEKPKKEKKSKKEEKSKEKKKKDKKGEELDPDDDGVAKDEPSDEAPPKEEKSESSKHSNSEKKDDKEESASDKEE